MEGTKTSPSRRRWIVAGSLLIATALAGAATRGLPDAHAPAPKDGRHFTAPALGPVTFSGKLDKTAVLVGGEPVVRMELALTAADREDDRAGALRVPTDLIVVLDRSGSMGGSKIEYARAAILELLSGLGPDDRFGLVVYDDVAEVPIAPASATARAREAWSGIVSSIAPRGGTNLSVGLDRGVALMRTLDATGRASRLILLSDGLANQGDVSREGLLGRAAKVAAGEAALTTVGVGADFDEHLMTGLADAGTGNYYFLESAYGLANVFAREFDAARTTVASALEVRIQPGDGVEVIDAGGYPLAREGRTVSFRPGSLFAGQDRRVWVTLRVPNHEAGEHALGRFALAWKHQGEQFLATFDELPQVAAVAREDDFYAAIDTDAWERSVLVDRYNQMQQKVAREVKAGNREKAKEEIAKFRDEVAEVNARVASPSVAQSLEELPDLEAEVDDAFVGRNQAAKQNTFSKTRGAEAYDSRRVGAKR